MTLLIKKASGEIEPFNAEKIERSLRKVHAPESLIGDIIKGIENAPEITSTRDVYYYISHYLRAFDRPLASRYNLKNALYQLGPEGFLFEKFIAELFKAKLYETANDRIIQGTCVDHEIDVVAFKDDARFMVECKFHNSPGLKTDVKVALYIKSRFDDIKHTVVGFADNKGTFNQPWLPTNTKFTGDAIAYAQCSAMGLIGWAYPVGTSIKTTVDYYGLYPITTLVSLSYDQKKRLLDQGILLCNELVHKKQALLAVGLYEEQAEQVLKRNPGSVIYPFLMKYVRRKLIFS